jgi:hypothetical protein
MDLKTDALQYIPLDTLGYGERPRVDRINQVTNDGHHLLVGTDHLTEFIREVLRFRKTDAIQHGSPSPLKRTP